MNNVGILKSFFDDVINQNADDLRTYFTEDAIINWHDTNEQFNVEEYIIANCEYPGEWYGKIEKLECIEDLVISVARIWNADETIINHVISFVQFSAGKIVSLNEYYGDIGNPPQWRIDKNIGRKIK